jgi:DUF2937 family protein
MRAHPVAFVVSLVVAVALSQALALAHQYQQHLDATIGELQRVIQQSGYDKTAALQPMSGNAEQRVRGQASRMDEVIARHGRLRAQENAFRDGGTFVRTSAFILNFDQPLVQRTVLAYQPAIPLTAEGLLLASGGFLGAYLLLPAFGEFGRRRRQLRAKLRASMVK